MRFKQTLKIMPMHLQQTDEAGGQSQLLLLQKSLLGVHKSQVHNHHGGEHGSRVQAAGRHGVEQELRARSLRHNHKTEKDTGKSSETPQPVPMDTPPNSSQTVSPTGTKYLNTWASGPPNLHKDAKWNKSYTEKMVHDSTYMWKLEKRRNGKGQIHKNKVDRDDTG